MTCKSWYIITKILQRYNRIYIFPKMRKELFIKLWKVTFIKIINLKAYRVLELIKNLNKVNSIVGLMTIPLFYEIFLLTFNIKDPKKISNCGAG